MRVLLKHGTIYDGTGAPPIIGDILIEDDKIIDIQPQIEIAEADIWDVSGKNITQGFIDSHRHCDGAALTSTDFGEIELAQGITTVLSGNCGMSLCPSQDHSRKAMYDFLEPCLGVVPEDVKLYHYKDYIQALNATGQSVNIGGLVGIGAIKIAVKGFSKSPFTKEEMAITKNYVCESLEQGAYGLSAGIMYVPECYSSKEEYIQLLKAAAKYDSILSCHIRGEGDILLDSVKEIIDISVSAEIPLNISHFKSVGIKNWDTSIYKAIEYIEASKADVSVDFYPYTGGSTTLLTLIPPDVMMEDQIELLHKLSTGKGQDELRLSLCKSHDGWDNMVEAIGFSRIIISSVGLEHNQKYIGKSIEENTIQYAFQNAVEFICHLLCEEAGKVGIIVMSMLQSDIAAIARLPYSMVISDSLYGNTDSPHPRLYGAFTKIIREYVIERNILSMENAIHKMTGLTAKRFHISKRGILRPGYYADINIFEEKKIIDRASFQTPRILSEGMKTIIINGKTAWENQKRDRSNNGRILVKEENNQWK